MRLFGSCEAGRSERKLELVRADAYDELAKQAADAQGLIAAVADVAERLAGRPKDEIERAYRSAQEIARGALRAHPVSPPAASDDEPVDVATTWWCPECDSLDAPQPCLGICVWRPVEWVSRSLYSELQEQVLDRRERTAQARALLGSLVHVTPRAGHWEQSARLIQVHARELLAVG